MCLTICIVDVTITIRVSEFVTVVDVRSTHLKHTILKHVSTVAPRLKTLSNRKIKSLTTVLYVLSSSHKIKQSKQTKSK